MTVKIGTNIIHLIHHFKPEWLLSMDILHILCKWWRNHYITTSLSSAGWGTRSPSQRNCPAAEANDTRLHTTNTVATKQPRPKPRGFTVREIMQERVCKQIKDVGELHQLTVEEWEHLSEHVIDNAIRQRLRGCVNADGGHKGRHFHFLSVWLYCIDCIATCSALYSLVPIRLFIARNIYYTFDKVQCQ